jgi:hypothetical protein
MSRICPEFLGPAHFDPSVADDAFLRQEPDEENEEEEDDGKDHTDDDDEEDEGYSE